MLPDTGERYLSTPLFADVPADMTEEEWRSRPRRRSASCRRSPRPKRQRGRTSTGHRGRPRRTRRGLFTAASWRSGLARISERYRGQGTSATITDEADALAYALARMPATYAAISRVLRGTLGPRPRMDAGIDPRRRGRAGTATWAARELWPDAEAVLLDRNPALLRFAERDLCRGRSDGARKPRVRNAGPCRPRRRGRMP